MECTSAFEVSLIVGASNAIVLYTSCNSTFSRSTIFTRHLSSVDGGDDGDGVGEDDGVESFDAEQGAEPKQWRVGARSL